MYSTWRGNPLLPTRPLLGPSRQIPRRPAILRALIIQLRDPSNIPRRDARIRGVDIPALPELEDVLLRPRVDAHQHGTVRECVLR